MGRPFKLTKEDVRYIIENFGKKSSVAIGRKIGCDHSTVLAWAKRLREAGFTLPERYKLGTSTPAIVDELRTEYGIPENRPQVTQEPSTGQG